MKVIIALNISAWLFICYCAYKSEQDMIPPKKDIGHIRVTVIERNKEKDDTVLKTVIKL